MPPKLISDKELRREAKKAQKKAEKKQVKANTIIHPVLGRNPEVYCGGMRLGAHWPFEVPVALLDLGLTVPLGWSNMNTHAIISRACLVDKYTGELREGIEIVGPPVPVNSHFGAFASFGTVQLRVACQDSPAPLMMTFVVIDNDTREGMVGNAALVALGVQDIHKYKTKGGYSVMTREAEGEEGEEEEEEEVHA